jgi:ankyrin repeat protein
MSDFSWFFAAQQPSSTASESLITPLFTAASRGDADSLRAAIADESEDLSVNGWCSYHVAAAKGHVKCLQILKEMRYPLPSALLVPTPSGLNALHLAAKNAQVPACAFLIESSGDEAVESICSDGHTSLTISCHSGHIEVVRFLVGAGANPATASSEGMTPLLVAATAGHLEILELLSDLKPEGRNLLCAVSLGGHTVLHKASGAGHTKVVDYLLKRRQEILLAESVVEGGGSRSAGVNDPRLSFADVDVLSLTGASSLHMAAQGISWDRC